MIDSLDGILKGLKEPECPKDPIDPTGQDKFEKYFIGEDEELKIKVNPTDPTTVPKFVDPLPVPPVAKPIITDKGEIFYNIEMKEVKHKFHKYFPPTTVWGYNGMCPGPTIEVQKDVHVKVKWENTSFAQL